MCFKRWSRKNYGIFASLGRKTKIGVLSVSMSIVLLEAETVRAQALGTSVHPVTDPVPLLEVTSDPITVNSSVNYHHRMSLTSLYGGDYRGAVQTLEAALKTSPSFDIRERGGKGVQADISVRGGSFDQTMVLLNGINFTDARTGHQTHSLPVDMDVVSSISLVDDIVKSGAYAGAINIKTNPARENYLRVDMSGGGHGYRYANLSGAATRKYLQVFGAASWRKSDGYIANTDFERINAYVGANYDSYRLGRFDFQAGLQKNSFGANGFYSLKYPNQYEQTATGLASLKWSKSSEWMDISADVFYRKNLDRFELIKDAPETVPFNYHDTGNFGADFQIGSTGRKSNTTLGASYVHNGILSTVLGEPVANPTKKVWGNDSNRLYTKSKKRDVLDVWLSQDYSAGNFSIVGWGGMNSSPYGTAALWGVTAQQVVAKMHSVFYAGAVHSMRLPTFTDLYYTATGYTGNTDLVPETAVTYRLGSDYAHNGVTASAVVYYRDGSNIIDWVKNSTEENWRSMQITSLGTLGCEVSLGYCPKGILYSAKLGYAYISQDKKSTGYAISKYALDYMRNKLSTTVELRTPDKRLSLSVTGTLFDRAGNYADVSGSVKGYEPYFLMDGRLAWDCTPSDRVGVCVYLEMTNIASTEYFDYGGLPMPGRWTNAGMRITL